MVLRFRTLQATPPTSPRGRQPSREESSVKTLVNNPQQRSQVPTRTLPRTPVKSDRDLYNDLLDEATGTNHTSNSSNSSLEYDGNNSSRSTLSFDADVSNGTPKSPKKVIVDSLQPPRPKSPGHTGHERRQKFTFVGDMLDEDNDGVDEFGEEETEINFEVSKPKAIRHVVSEQAKKVATSSTKSKKKPSTARCDAV